MLESLTLRNFQKWEILSVEFDPYLTIFWGPTGVGKSCALRALEWLCLNSFRGDWYIRRGSKSTSVSLTLDNQQIITRYRGPDGNGYKFKDQTYEALYGSIPTPITDLLQIDENSFSTQFDGPFWLLLSKPEVSRQLNAIVNLDLIDRVLGDLATQVRKAKDNVEASENRLKVARQEKKDLAWVLDADDALTEIEATEAKQQETLRKSKDLTLLLDRIEQQQILLANGERELVALMDIITTGDKLQATQKQLQNLEAMLEQIEQTQDRVGLATASLEAAELQLRDYGQGRCPTCGKGLEDG